jgi:hypothetical protein
MNKHDDDTDDDGKIGDNNISSEMKYSTFVIMTP